MEMNATSRPYPPSGFCAVPRATTAHPPRILFAISSLSAGGAERILSAIANAWADAGWQIGVMTLAGCEQDHYGLHPAVVRIPLALLFPSHSPWRRVSANLQRSLAIRKSVRGFAPDCVVSFIDQTNVRVLAALTGCRIPVVVSERVDPRYHDIGRIWSWARRVLYRRAAKVVVQTESVAEWARGFLAPAKVTVIPNFVALPACELTARQRDAGTILAVGRLVAQKGFDLLLRAFAATGLANAGMRLTILGEGPERRHLEQEALALGISTSVDMPGIVATPGNWMARCTIFVLPSRFEGFPNALLEAMALGCAVIAANCPSGPATLIKDGDNGLLVPAEDITALTAALARLAGDPERRLQLGRRALAVRDEYALEAVLACWEDLLMQTIGGHRAAHRD